MTEPASIMVRAQLTSDEWKRLRMLALREGVPTSHIVGKLLRDFVELNDPDAVVTRPRRRR